ncbi:hypothetical protein TcasGA2_TC031128 [Tribolium castaneum]|uniref:Uncharacterized protein n=1 Tax=Tribolium castaneum TaxID=7070 RepID=A0A139WIP7_TRICA|nr:hypothetical protein TcasGA2_TC031128 [Tribolium castaneum]
MMIVTSANLKMQLAKKASQVLVILRFMFLLQFKQEEKEGERISQL